MNTTTLRYTTLHRHTGADAGRLRTTFPVLLGRVCAEVEGAALVLALASDQDGTVTMTVSAQAPGAADAAAVAQEVALLFEEVAEPGEPGQDGPAGAVWPLVARRASALGYTVPGAPAGTVVWKAEKNLVEAVAAGTPLADIVAANPGCAVRVRVAASDTADEAWTAEVAVLLPEGVAPSLRLRAALRATLPGLAVADAPGGPPQRLRLDAESLPTVLAVPVAAGAPIGGMAAGSFPNLPVPAGQYGVRQHGAGQHGAGQHGADSAGAARIGAGVTAAGRRVGIHLGGEERRRHLHVLGRTGTGKSSFLAGLTHHLADAGEGVLVLDPHGTLVKRIAAELPGRVLARTWMIRAGDLDNPVPINPLAVTDPAARDVAIAAVGDMFQYLFDKGQTGIVGPRFIERVSMGLRALHAVHGPRASLLQVPAALADNDFMRAAVAAQRDTRLKQWWENEQRGTRSNDHPDLVSWVNSKFEALSGTAALRAILASGHDGLDLPAAMDSGRIILVDLSKAELGEHASRLLGYLYLQQAWAGALTRRRTDRTFTVVVDEAHTVISGALTNMLAEGRKFGLSVVLAHQFLAQLDGDLRPATSGNIATTVTFRTSADDAAQVRRNVGAAAGAVDLTTLPDLTALLSRTAGAFEPHTLLVDHNSSDTAALADAANVGRAQANAAADLAAPWRADTTAAVEALPPLTVRLRPPVTPPPPVAPPPATPPPATKPAGSFLDEWLAKREAARDRSSDAA